MLRDLEQLAEGLEKGLVALDDALRGLEATIQRIERLTTRPGLHTQHARALDHEPETEI